MKRDQALATLRTEKDRLSRDYGVKSLALFGSVARDEATAVSDVDLLVEFDRPTGLFGLFALQDFLESCWDALSIWVRRIASNLASGVE